MLDPLAGHVVVVAATDAAVGARWAEELCARGVLVALVAPAAGQAAAGDALVFAADPLETATWDRVAPHIEQRLGPVDAVVTDGYCADVARGVFAPDLARRGHGDVVVADAATDVVTSLSRLLTGTR